MTSHRYCGQERFLIAAWYECFKSPIIVRRKYRARFGINAQLPTRSTIQAIHSKAVNQGECSKQQDGGGRPRTSTSDDNKQLVLQHFKQHPRSSLQRASLQLSIDRTAIWRILHDHKFHPYVMKRRHQMDDEDMCSRVSFAEEILPMIETNKSFLGNILFSDEAHFHLSGEINRHNCIYWAVSDPGENHIETVPLHSPYVTVWIGVMCNQLLGPFFFDNTVTMQGQLPSHAPRLAVASIAALEGLPAATSLVPARWCSASLGVGCASVAQ